MRIRPGAVILAIVVLTGGYLAGHVLVAILGWEGAVATVVLAGCIATLTKPKGTKR